MTDQAFSGNDARAANYQEALRCRPNPSRRCDPPVNNDSSFTPNVNYSPIAREVYGLQ